MQIFRSRAFALGVAAGLGWAGLAFAAANPATELGLAKGSVNWLPGDEFEAKRKEH